MSKLNSEEKSDPISEQVSQQVNQQGQQQIEEEVSASDSEISAKQSISQTREDLQKSTEQTGVKSAELDLQISQEPLELSSETHHKPESINSSIGQATSLSLKADNSGQFAHPSPTSTKWAPLIYGRTYEVDFRFLVTPPDFDERIKNQVWKFIKITTRSAENLSGKPRWIFLRTESHCIMGVTCLVRDLLNSQEDDGSEDLTRDRHGRPLYAFVGFVADTPVPSIIPTMDLDLFSDPYLKLVPRKWHEHYAGESQKGVSQALLIDYCKEFRTENRVTVDPARTEIQFEQLTPKSQDTIVFWDIADAKSILFSASQCAEPIFLCFGNLTQRDLLDSQFMSAALDEVKSRQEVAKLLKVDPSQTQNSKLSQPSGSIRQQSKHTVRSQHIAYQENWNENSNTSKNFNPIENVLRFIEEGVGHMLEKITSVEEPQLRSYEIQLMAALDSSVGELNYLVAELQDLISQNLHTEANQKNKEIEIRKNKICSTQEKLKQVRQRIAEICKSSERLEQYNQPRQPQSDPYAGFKEKEKSADEQSLKPEPNVSESRDSWQL